MISCVCGKIGRPARPVETCARSSGTNASPLPLFYFDLFSGLMTHRSALLNAIAMVESMCSAGDPPQFSIQRCDPRQGEDLIVMRTQTAEGHLVSVRTEIGWVPMNGVDRNVVGPALLREECLIHVGNRTGAAGPAPCLVPRCAS